MQIKAFSFRGDSRGDCSRALFVIFALRASSRFDILIFSSIQGIA